MAANLALRSRRSNRKQHLEKGLAGGPAARSFDREQPALGNRAAVRGDAVRIVAGLKHAVTGNDDHKGIASERLGDRANGPRNPELGSDLSIGDGLAIRNGARKTIDPLVEGGDARHVEVTCEKSAGSPRSSATMPSIAVSTLAGARTSRASG